MITWEGCFWWPAPGALSVSPDIPDDVAQAYSEGIRCLCAGAPNGAAAMFRTAMTWVVRDKGSEQAKKEGDLKSQVRCMVDDGGLAESLGDWVDHVRLTGNAGVHPDLFGSVSMDEAKDVQRLVETLLDLLYVTPATIARRQAQRSVT